MVQDIVKLFLPSQELPTEGLITALLSKKCVFKSIIIAVEDNEMKINCDVSEDEIFAAQLINLRGATVTVTKKTSEVGELIFSLNGTVEIFNKKVSNS